MTRSVTHRRLTRGRTARTTRPIGPGGRSFAAPRSLDQLLDDHGTPLTPTPVAAEPAGDDRVFTTAVPRRGYRRPGHGWAPTWPGIAGYELTSDQAPVLWPLIAGHGLPTTGAPMGFDVLSGGAFYCDPMGWVTDDTIPVTNPNIFIFGKPGRGKSALVKAFLLRMIRFGYRTLVLGDVKDEYEDIAHALGVQPFHIGPGLPGRINPLDPGPLGHGWADLDPAETQRRAAVLLSRWLTLVRGLVGSQQIPFTPSESRVITKTLRDLTGWTHAQTQLTTVTLPQLWARLDQPTDQLVADCRYQSRHDFYDATRGLRDALGVLVEGELAGLFDAPTTFHPDWRAPIQTLSLSALHGDGNEAAVGIALMCLNSWGQGMRELSAPGDRRIVLRDEAWMQTRLGVDAVKTLDASLRLSRNDGDIQVVTYHKPSDPLSAGDQTSQAAQIAKDLLNLADTRILLGQDPNIAAELGELLGLAPLQQQLVTGWAMQAKGRALWMVGDRPFKVQTLLTPLEERLTDTNQAMTGPSRPASP
jgi:hypothetical protein